MAERLEKWGRAVAGLLHLSPDLLTGGLTVTIYAGQQAVVEGYKQILEYDDNLLRLSDGRRQLRILGTQLRLSEMSDEGLVVDGQIQSAEFESLRRETP